MFAFFKSNKLTTLYNGLAFSYNFLFIYVTFNSQDFQKYLIKYYPNVTNYKGSFCC